MNEQEVEQLKARLAELEERERIKEFDLHWLHGPVQRVRGRDIADAVNSAGYGGGALRALDYWAEVKVASPNVEQSDDRTDTSIARAVNKGGRGDAT